MSLHALAAYLEQERVNTAWERALEDVEERETIALFRAYFMTTSGPGQRGEYKLTLGTDQRHKDAMFSLTDHVGEFFEIEIRTIRIHTSPAQQLLSALTAAPEGWETEDVDQ